MNKIVDRGVRFHGYIAIQATIVISFKTFKKDLDQGWLSFRFYVSALFFLTVFNVM